MRKEQIVLAAAVVSSLGVGAASGYFFAVKKLGKEFDERLTKEIAATKEHYARLAKADEYETPVEAAKTLGVVVEEETGEEKTSELLNDFKEADYTEYSKKAEPYSAEEETKVVVTNIFETRESEMDPEEMIEVEAEWDYDVEVAKRGATPTFILAEEEYFANEPENEQVTMTFFAGDEVLVDSSDNPLTSSEMMRLIGHANNLRFGFGSNDPSIVYIRNTKLDLDMEICLSEGKYATEVLGYIEHEDRLDRRSRRGDDG